jgi:sarcosine oxidase subunit alpha
MADQGMLTARRISPSESQVIDREVTLRFTFDGQEYTAYAGDTIASALAAAGVKTFSRSFKYHRRRGLLCVAGNCPNCLLTVDGTPNVRSCKTPVQDGMKVSSQNAWPSLDTDAMSLVQLAARFLPVGFYYKAFMRPQQLWPLYEKALRHAAGLGQINPEPETEAFDKGYLHADVTVIGGGPAGLRAALAAAGQGAHVALLEEDPWLGGHLRYSREILDGQPAFQHVAELVGHVEDHPGIAVHKRTLAFGWYDHNWIGAVGGQRLFKLRARTLVVASGTYEYPPVFENNDLPGVMLASGARRLLHLWGVLPGKRAIVVSANRRGLQTALDLIQAGVEVPLVAELREGPESELFDQLRDAGVEVLTDTTVAKATGGRSLTGVQLRDRKSDESRQLDCDLLVLACGFMPADGLLHQAGGKFAWREELSEFIPTQLPATIFAAGEAAGTHRLEDIEREGQMAGLEAAVAAGFDGEAIAERIARLNQSVAERRATCQPWSALPSPPPEGKKDFVCLCEDITKADVAHSIQEGYDSVELLKRYSTISMGPCQGKMCNMNAMRLAAHYNHQPVAQTGTTTSRPPVRPVSLGTLAGRPMEPVRVSPMHAWHLAHGARLMNAGLWKRPEHYGDPLEEVRAVRQAVGLIDVSTLGKIHLSGPDVPALLERVYTNRWRQLPVGRVRYGVMVNEEGVVLDDGVTARLDDQLYYMTTTSSGAGAVYEWIEWWLQSGWELDVQLLPATELRAAMNLTGPRARQVLAKVISDVDLDNDAFPYLHIRQGSVAGAPAVLMRIGFTGELGYEIHTPSGYGLHVWEALMEAGEEFGIRPFGVEAQRVLRLEKGHLIVGQDTDALSNPYEANLGWVVKLDKEDFLGKPALRMASQRGAEKRLVGFEMPDGAVPEEANQIVRPGEGPLGLEIIGRLTSVRYSPTLDKVIGLGWLPAEMAEPGQTFSVRTHGELLTGRVVPLPFYDLEGARLRA